MKKISRLGNRLLCVFFCLSSAHLCRAQSTFSVDSTLELIRENSINEDHPEWAETDGYENELRRFIKHPINLNEASSQDLEALQTLTPLQVENLLQYRQQFGRFISWYELQAVPGWDVALIRKLRVYVTVREPGQVVADLWQRCKQGDHDVSLSMAQNLERSKGYQKSGDSTTNGYLGSPLYLCVRFQYRFKNLLDVGWLGEKDAGEQLFKGSRKTGFDFNSFHFFASRLGRIKAIAIGDFNVNLAQGLVMWQGFSTQRSSQVLNIKKQSPVLQADHSKKENDFMRGIGFTVVKNNLELTLFASSKKTDARLVRDSTTSITASEELTGGYHRTSAELRTYHQQRETVFGGNISLQQNNLHLGLNCVSKYTAFSVEHANQPYQYYSFTGSRENNASLDYAATIRNLHVFGETAVSDQFHVATLNGLLIALHPNWDMSLLYRSFPAGFQAINGKTFSKSVQPQNERGWYAGLSFHPSARYRFDAFYDQYMFPWLKYLVNSPSQGREGEIKCAYFPDKYSTLYIRYNLIYSEMNTNLSNENLHIITSTTQQNLRVHYETRLSKELRFLSRIDYLWLKPGMDKGYLCALELDYHPVRQKVAISMRSEYFSTDGYASRLYNHENDIPYSFNMNVLYNTGIRYYLLAKVNIAKKVQAVIKWSQTSYSDQKMVGSGLDEIIGNKKSNYSIHIQYVK